MSKTKISETVRKYKVEIIVILVAFAFSAWLMFSTFEYRNGDMMIASKAWSDFASHIPLIRSFSFGDNFPPQYPLFSGPPIKYHFLFYALVGFLEKTGIRIDYALNIPSALGFAFLMVMIYLFAKEIFKSKSVGILSVVFFLFNSSLDFINFLTKHSFSNNIFWDIVKNQQFMSFGPYDGKIISAFWNLNIYTNQRHLALSFGLSLLLIYLILKFKNKRRKESIKKGVLIGIILGLSFILNMAVFLMTIIVLLVMLLLIDKKRIYIFTALFIASIIALPQYLFTQSGISTFKPLFYPGYLVDHLNTLNFINYWFQNIGLSIFLVPLGFLFAPRIGKKILICFLSLFIVGNLIKFSPEIAANHKFFNYFMLVAGMFSAYFLYYLWNKKIFLKPFVPIFIFILTFSGIINFFPIFNDSKITLSDYPVNKDAAWIIKNTNPNSVFLNTQYLYDNASLAGRKIFLGWPYFSWSQGYDTLTRDNLRKSLLNAADFNYFCENVNKHNLSYVELSPTNDIAVNKIFFKRNFTLLYKDVQTNTLIYDLRQTCIK